jgi:electron transfer flavoprotein alpha subunit
MTCVLTFSESERTALELLAAAHPLAAGLKLKVVAAWVGPGAPASLAEHGASEVVHLTGPGIEAFTAERYAEALASLAAELKPQVVLVGATRSGKDLAGRLAARLKAAGVSEAQKVTVGADGALTAERTFLSGNAVQAVRLRTLPAVITIPPRANEPPTKAAAPSPKREVQVAASARVPEVIEVTEKSHGGIRIEDAPFIVSAGRGFKKKEDLAIIEDLAKALGAQVGCSRPLATDLAWMSEDHWVGLSGHKVRPKVYITLGISGQIQHIAGIRDSEAIIAVNTDANAPIFKACDLGVVADLYKFIPALKAAAQRHRGG